MISKYFSHSVGYFFTLLIVYLTVQKLFSLMWFHLFICAFVDCAFGVNFKKSLPMESQVVCTLCFLLGVLWFQVSHSNPF